jgi:hypothetical protein
MYLSRFFLKQLKPFSYWPKLESNEQDKNLIIIVSSLVKQAPDAVLYVVLLSGAAGLGTESVHFALCFIVSIVRPQN